MYSNCLLIALIEKIKKPKNELHMLKPRKGQPGLFHIVWREEDGRCFHFTRELGYDVKCELWFKGHIEELHPDIIERMKRRNPYESTR